MPAMVVRVLLMAREADFRREADCSEDGAGDPAGFAGVLHRCGAVDLRGIGTLAVGHGYSFVSGGGGSAGRLRGPTKGVWFHLYVTIDICSRCNPSWIVAAHESG